MDQYVVYKNDKKRADRALQIQINQVSVKLCNEQGMQMIGKMLKWIRYVHSLNSGKHRICYQVQQCNNIENNQYRYVLKDICHIQFPQLLVIDLTLNEIQSIEGLHRLFMPALKQLHLGQNKITSLKEFNKLNRAQLRKISIKKNKISEGNPINRMKICAQVQCIIIDQRSNHIQTIQDMSWMCKNEAKIVHSLCTLYVIIKDIHNEKRMKQKKVKEAIINKYEYERVIQIYEQMKLNQLL